MNQSKLTTEERVRRISELLKAADRYVLSGDFHKATERVNLIFDIDPNNIYAKAYLKRIEVFKRKRDKQAEREQTPSDVSSIPGDESPESKQWKKEDSTEKIKPAKKLSADEKRKIVEDIISEQADFINRGKDEKQRVLGQEEYVPEKYPETVKQEEDEKKYRQALERLWKSGTFSENDRKEVEKLRELLGISRESHDEIERSVKLSAYVDAVKDAWRDGLINPASAKVLEDLRDKYRVSIDEHLMIESRIMYELHGMRVKGVVMVVDDDPELSKVIKSILREEGYAPFSSHKPEQGLKILEKTTPDLILLDITFPKPSISGFTMYEQIRKRPNLRFVPVVFMSGLDEEHIVQLGKKMGADDYIIKPISEDLLVSTIEGKIKRYKEMRKTLEQID